VSRRSLARYIDWCGDALPRRGDGVPLFATASFDHAVTCLFPPLVAGEPIKLMPEFGEGEQLGEALLARGPYSFVKATPSHMRLLSADQRARLGTASAAILLGGEASDLALVASLRRDDPGLRILNHYGPTEATVGCLVFEVPLDHAAEAIPIGAPMPHVSVRVEDGELLIGGDCLASGYWRQGVGPVATGGFFADAAGLRWYRSGDLVGRTASGDLIHEGRLDRQVKHLGHRIELEEVESALRRVDTVEDACVVQLKDGGHLVAAVVPAAGLDEGEIKEEAAAGLISQAIPRQVVRVEALPTNVNGKCDFDAVASLFDPVAGPAEELSLADLWRDVLEVDGEIGPEDDFFELGGDSLAAVELVETIGARHGVELEISILFTASAFGDFEKAVHQLTAEGSRDVVG
jgi:acyl-coenzyme A synthetase/AMP-(fatty) acid ligase